MLDQDLAAGDSFVAAAQEDVVGFVEVVSDTTISGWAFDATSTEPLELQLVIDGQQVETVVCDRLRSDVLRAGLGRERVGFAFSIPTGFCDGEPHRVEFHCKYGCVRTLKNNEGMPQAEWTFVAAAEYTIVAMDPWHGRDVSCWAIIADRRSGALRPADHVIVRQAGVEIDRLAATVARPDLVSHYDCHPVCGFTYPYRKLEKLTDPAPLHFIAMPDEREIGVVEVARVFARRATPIDVAAGGPQTAKTTAAEATEGLATGSQSAAARAALLSAGRQGKVGRAKVGAGLSNLAQQFDAARPWFYFDAAFYIAQCALAGVTPTIGSAESYRQHYLQRGGGLGLSPNPLFDEDLYRRRYPDVLKGIQHGKWVSGFDHYVHAGAKSDMSPTWFFDASFYRAMHPDITDEFLEFGQFSDRYAHYLLVGLGERRAAHWTIQALNTIKEDSDFPTDRIALSALMEGGAGLPDIFQPVFDYAWMREKYEWHRAVRPRDFIRHYLLNVRDRQLWPSPYFDEGFYLANEPEVREAVSRGDFVSGYEHFVLHGMAEWRKPFAAFDSQYYFERTMAAAGGGPPGEVIAPFTHFLRHRKSARLAISRPLAERNIPEDMGKALYERRCQLNAGRLGNLALQPAGTVAEVSVIIVVRDNFEQTANCIISAVYNTRVNVEIVVFDNGSADNTRRLAAINPGIKYLRAETNLGFTIAVNRAAEVATGRVVLLLNNDLELTPGAIDMALQTLDSSPDIGAVGGKIVRMHGRLQEGGSLIWRDGTCLGYARDADPRDGQVSFIHDVDFCSGCFLLMRRSDWQAMGGFDDAYAPAYFEETDLCVRIWERGQRVVYDPRAVVWHFEYGTSSIREEPLALMRRNQRYFVSKHRSFLAGCLAPLPAHIEAARLRHVARPRVLFVEDRLPDPAKGAGFVRSAQVADVLGQHCGLVSMLGLHDSRWPTDLPQDGAGRRVEILSGVNALSAVDLLENRLGVYDIVWLSRTHNLSYLKAWQKACPAFFAGTRIVLDTEAISASRKAAYAALAGHAADLAELVAEELEYLDGVDHVCAVNARDRDTVVAHLERRGMDIPVSILGHALAMRAELPQFAETRDIVLVGSYAEFDGPNADGLLWFDREIRPLLPELPGLRFVIAGHQAGRFAQSVDLLHDYDIIDNPVSMSDVYRSARLLVAPTRFAGGIPMKVHEAASHGVPVAMTDLLALQLGWKNAALGISSLSAPHMASTIARLSLKSAAWQRARTVQLALIQKDCSMSDFEACIKQIVSRLMPARSMQASDNR